MATVYLASTQGPMGFEAEVALKLTHPHLRESPEFAADLLEEAKLAVRIRHRNVAAVLDADVDPLGVYLVMEYVEGDTLVGLTRASRYAPKPMALRVLLDALAGLHAAHELSDEQKAPLGLVHRDFTPHNILVGTDGVARLTDFGIAKAATRLSHTRTGSTKGKIGYMAPEQARGMLVDRRCDVWAAGVIAWELLAGKRLYSVGEDLATLLKVATETPPRLRTVAPWVHSEVEDAVASALATEPETRCPSALAFARLLGAACRAHVGVADHDEVADWVSRTVGPKLGARREMVTRVREMRARASSGSMATAATEHRADSTDATTASTEEPTTARADRARDRSDVSDDAVATLSAPTVALRSGGTPADSPKGKTRSAAIRPGRTSMVAGAAEEPRFVFGSALFERAEPTPTDAASVVTQTTRGPVALRARVLSIGAGITVLALVALVGGGRRRTIARDTDAAARAGPTVLAASTPALTPSGSTAPTPTPTATPVASETAPRSEAPPASTATANPRRREVVRSASPTARQPPPPATADPAPLAPSPY
jgi:serine/threonine-protein kinase